MKAFGHQKKGDASVLQELVNVATPSPSAPRDILVNVKGISVNPVDYKIREWMDPAEGEDHRILGWDACGVVTAVGDAVEYYKVGDEVFYAGELTKPGSNAEYQLVDERLVGKKPASLSFAEAAGFPLTSITAWELLFESLDIQEGSGKGESVLIIGAAGGVGSVAIQLAKQLTQLTVVATASRPDTIAWVQKMGADHVINHRNPLAPQIKALIKEAPPPKYVISLNGTGGHFADIIELIQPRGRIALIDDPESLDLTKHSNFKLKALSLSWEFMFARSMFQTKDMNEQRLLLNRVSEMIDAGSIQSIVTTNLGKLSLESLRDAHEAQASGKSIGKNVLEM